MQRKEAFLNVVVWIEQIAGEEHDLDEVAMGEEFVFELGRRVCGCRVDEYHAWDLPMDQYYRPRRGPLGWLLGR